MGDSHGTTRKKTPFQGMSLVSPPCGDVGPPFMDTLSLPEWNIGLPMWLNLQYCYTKCIFCVG